MNTLPQIEKAILRLPSGETARLLEWLSSLVRAPSGVAEAAPVYTPEMRGPMSFEEYMEFEERSPTKHEYLAGRVFAMSGVTRRHNRIAGRLYCACASHLKGGPCEPYMSDVKVRLQVGKDTCVYYPDMMVVCGPSQDEDRYAVDPKLIVEVLSDSTARTDRHEKRIHYRWIQALEEYVIVAQEFAEVTIFRRDEDWQPAVLASLEATLELRSIGLLVPLSQIYEGKW